MTQAAPALGPHRIQVPVEIVDKWQEMMDLLAEIIQVPAALIMRVEPPNIEVFVSSKSKGNPYHPHELACLDDGFLCETVLRTRKPLLVPDALQGEEWKSNRNIKLGMVSYLGLPISWPDGEIFGTICVHDNKRNEYAELYHKLLRQARDVLQADLRSLLASHRELEQREAKIRRLMDSNIIGIFIWDSGRITEANDAFLRMIGYDRGDLASGRVRWTDLTPPEWRDDSARRAAEVMATGTAQPREKEYFRKDGSRVPVLVGVASFEEGANEGVAFVLDLTERKKADQALRDSEERFRTLVQFSFDVYWESDAQHRFIRQEFAEGVADAPGPGSELGKTRWEVPHLEPDAEAWRKHRETLDAHLPFRDFELARPTPDGGKRYVSVSGLPVFDERGRFVGYRGVGRHITERKRAEAQVRENERRLREVQTELAHATRVATMGQLTASIAHEVNQPIAGVVASGDAALNWLAKETPDLERARRSIERVIKDAKRAGDVVGRIYDLIKKAPPRQDSFDINEAVREVIGLTRGEAVKNGVSVQTQLAQGLPLIEGDRVQLQQVILNLVINAIEAMSGTIEGLRELLISTARSERYAVLVAVRDTGPGLDQANPERVFEAFYTTKLGGLGMGLSICRSIIEAHGGQLGAMANVPHGAIFQFAVPGRQDI